MHACTYTAAEFVGCSPSLSGAIRVNPWSVDSGYNGLYAAICMPLEHRRLRHQKHWRYVSQHTVAYWAQSYITDLMVGAHWQGPLHVCAKCMRARLGVCVGVGVGVGGWCVCVCV